LFLLCVSSVDGSTRESAFPTKTKLVKYYIIIRRFDIENYIQKLSRLESQSRLTYVSQKKDVTSLAINWTLGATRRIFSPFYQNFSFLFGDVVAFYELLPRRISLFGATSFESRNMKHSFQKETKETEKFRRAWNKWKTNKFPDRKKQKKTKGVPSVIKSSCECYIYSDLMYTIRRIWIILGNHQIYTNRSYYMLCTYYNSTGSLWRDLKRTLIL
jgi:hypothetical protein